VRRRRSLQLRHWIDFQRRRQTLEVNPSPKLCAYQCNARLPQVRARGGGRSELVGQWTSKFPRGGGDLSLPKQHTFRSCGSPILIPGFVTGRHVGECGGLHHQCFPSRWGIVIFKDANPHLPPSQPVPVVVGHYIDRYINTSLMTS